MKQYRKKRRASALPWIAAVALLVCAAAAVLLFTVKIGEKRYLRADVIDARDAALSEQDYVWAAAQLPGSAIRWSVPIGREDYDSFSETLTLSSLPERDVPMLRYFPYLREIDARACADYAALAAAARLLPETEIRWTVPSADGAVDGNTGRLAVRASDAEELRALLPLLPRLETVDLRESALTDAETDALCAEFPAISFLYTVRLPGRELPSDTASLTVGEGETGDYDALKTALPRLRGLESLDLRGAALSALELRALLPLCPADTRYLVPLGGALWEPESEELDLSGIPITEVSEVDAAVALMPRLKKLVMCDCGLSDEEMAALGLRHPDTRFVWTVHFSVYSLRTDATVFCASDLPSRGFVAPAVSSEELAPLRYCTDLVALDLGHMFFRDLDFLEGLTQLRWLILVEERFHDISVLATLENLEYLELFNNTIDDISPLLSCRSLRHLNVGYTRGYDPGPLAEMVWLDRLWYPGNRLGKEGCDALAAALPDTICYLPSYDADGSTGGGWRTHEAYYEMRNAFGMFYQPGGTGTEKQG